MILGMNPLVFILLAWLVITALAWLCDYGPEIYREQKVILAEKYLWSEEEMTVEIPVQYDPDKTIVIPKIEHEIQVVFVIDKAAVRTHRRHARV